MERLFVIGDACIAEKMSWASRRYTTRIEDEAYCLMGIFDVNMPLIYGEGEKAFKRLQLEIIKSSDDESIFVHHSDRSSWYVGHADVFADSLRPFRFSEDIKRVKNPFGPQELFHERQVPYAMTNKGLHISLFLIPFKAVSPQSQFQVGVLGLHNKPLSPRYVGLLLTLRDRVNEIPTILLNREIPKDGSAMHQIEWVVQEINQNIPVTSRWRFSGSIINSG